MVNALSSIFGGTVDELLFKVRVGEHDESKLVVAGFSAREALFRWDIDVVIDPEITLGLPTIPRTTVALRHFPRSETRHRVPTTFVP